ncbi:MAG: Holliday junction branch migration protein RuvA [Eubacteriales bacterium]|nr:Holliday junction branch migration protein RuvA [Eubacteriales bacterium]
MIAFLRGTVMTVTAASIYLDVNDVGYEVFVPLSTLQQMTKTGDEIFLHTHMSMKEDGITLFGFVTEEELRIFRLLISVSKVGPKLAMAILGHCSVYDIKMAIVAKDASTFTKVPGIGKKNAERILLDLGDKIDTGDMFDGHVSGHSSAASTATNADEAIDALIALGYAASEAAAVIRTLHITDEMSTNEILKLCLGKLSLF